MLAMLANKAPMMSLCFRKCTTPIKARTLLFSGYSGNVGDDLQPNNGFPFSTFDRDNEMYQYNCAELKQAGWWFHNLCSSSNLNGQLDITLPSNDGKHGAYWYFYQQNRPMQKVEMQIYV